MKIVPILKKNCKNRPSPQKIHPLYQHGGRLFSWLCIQGWQDVTIQRPIQIAAHVLSRSRKARNNYIAEEVAAQVILDRALVSLARALVTLRSHRKPPGDILAAR